MNATTSKDDDSSPQQYSETVNVQPVDRKLKILFLAANPDDTTRLRLDEEFRSIQNRIREAEFRDRIELCIRQAVRHGDLRLALLEEKPHIVHFSGHGNDRDELMLQNDQGTSHAASRKAVADLFKIFKNDIRLVVLNACFSERQAKGIVANIAFAIGMNQAIGDAAAIQFAEAFYQGIGFGRTLQEAFDLGTNALPLGGISEELTPQLLKHPKADPDKTQLFCPRNLQRLEKENDARQQRIMEHKEKVISDVRKRSKKELHNLERMRNGGRYSSEAQQKAVEVKSFELLTQEIEKLKAVEGYRDLAVRILLEVERNQNLPSGKKDPLTLITHLESLEKEFSTDVGPHMDADNDWG